MSYFIGVRLQWNYIGMFVILFGGPLNDVMCT